MKTTVPLAKDKKQKTLADNYIKIVNKLSSKKRVD